MLTKLEKNSILHAVSLGDGCIYPLQNGSLQLRIKHSIKQLDFLKWKRDLLEECLDKKININIKEQKAGFSEIPIKFCMLYVTSPKFNKVYKRLYENNRKGKKLTKKFLNRLDQRGLAIWYGDDGTAFHGKYIDKRNGKSYEKWMLNIATNEFNKDEHELLVEFFKNKWNINSNYSKVTDKRPNRKSPYYNWRMQSQTEVEKFLELVTPYLKNIPSMRRKILR